MISKKGHDVASRLGHILVEGVTCIQSALALCTGSSTPSFQGPISKILAGIGLIEVCRCIRADSPHCVIDIFHT